MEDYGANPIHGIDYNPNLLQVDARELLRLSQTNVTVDRHEGLQYAAAAVDKSFEIIHDDPMPYAKAAALLAFRTALSGDGAFKASVWFTRSIDHLQKLGDEGLRESIVTNILEGRSFDYLALDTVHAPAYNHDGITSLEVLANRAQRAYISAEQKIESLHKPDARWDRYAVMAPKFEAVHVSIFEGNTTRASEIALSGLRRALHADHENQSRHDHREFLKKQIAVGSAVLGFCMATPLDKLSSHTKRRREFAGKLFTGSS